MPVIGCQCEVCRSNDPHDRRLRCSAMVETGQTRILIDCGPDFREQMLGQEFRKIDAVLVTHSHYDHVGGIDDLRPFCAFGDIDILSDETSSTNIHNAMPYCFAAHLYPGVPKISIHTIRPHEHLRVNELEVIPFEVMHGKLPILGFRIGKLAYITDMKTIAEGEMEYLHDVDTLVVNALRFTDVHHSHMLIDEAVAFAKRVGAKRTFFTHMCHDVGLHKDVNNGKLPAGMQLAFDGEVVEIE